MKRKFLAVVAGIMLTACNHSVYIVRHAEKSQASTGTTMSTPNDPPLSDKGEQRALILSRLLMNKKIGYIFSTNTIRAKRTAAPLGEAIGIQPALYSQVDDAFINKLRQSKKNVLVVGHSNTVDDLVNRLSNTVHIKSDLPDSVYNNLYIIKWSGKKARFTSEKFDP